MAKSFLPRAMSCVALWAMLLNNGLGQMGSGQTMKVSRPPASPPLASVSGMVFDPSDALIVGASVSLGPGHRELWQTKTGADGEFQLDQVAPGHYELRVGYPGFKVQRTRLDVGPGKSSPLRIVLAIADLEESIKVDDSEAHLSVAASENADVVRLDPRQLENLPMLDRDVIGALVRLLDPASTGSGGPSVIVDGLPSSELHIPLSEIEEIRINDNSYSAEFMRPGRGRIEIITKSGSSKYHASLYFGVRDFRLDARNTFALDRPPQRRRQVEANLSGPLHIGKKDTFSLSASRMDDNLEPIVYAFGLVGPIRENAPQTQTSTYFSAQFTRRIAKNPLSFRYSRYDWSYKGKGAGGFVLPETGIDSTIRYHQLYSSYRAAITADLLHELFIRVRTEHSDASSKLPSTPKVVVLDAFTGGGAQVNTSGTDNRVEFTDALSWSHHRHLLKAGVNLPVFSRLGSTDRSDFNGTFYFSSLDDYAHGKPFSFLQQAGNPRLIFWQKQVGGFVQDQIKLRPNLSLSLGLRYDWQNYGSDYHNFAPRMSLAFAPGKAHKTVFRGGAGIFFDAMAHEAIVDMLRLDGNRLRQIQLLNPMYPDPFSAGLSIPALPPDIVRFSPTLKSPYIFQYSLGVERQLRKSLTFTATYVRVRGVDLFRSRDVNAPPPPFYLARPDPLVGALRQIESSGGLKNRTVQATLRGDLGRFFSGMIVYEWGRRMNDTNGITSFPANNWNPQGEWSRASSDSRNFVYLYGTVKAGKYFKLGAIFSANSGNPYTMTTGLDDYHDGLTNARPPGVPRNSLHGTGAATLDLRWSRDFPVHPSDKKGVQLVPGVDVFNLFNRANYSSFIGNLSSPFFGHPVSAAPARRMQISLTLKF